MKKVLYIFAAVAVVAMFSSCGGVNKKAKKYVKKAEKCVKLDLTNEQGQFTNVDDEHAYDKCNEDLDVMRAEILLKYVNKDEKRKDFNKKRDELISNTKVNQEKLKRLACELPTKAK